MTIGKIGATLAAGALLAVLPGTALANPASSDTTKASGDKTKAEISPKVLGDGKAHDAGQAKVDHKVKLEKVLSTEDNPKAPENPSVPSSPQ